MNIRPKDAAPADLAYPDGAILYHLSEDQYRALRAGGMGRELIEIELVTLAGSHLLDSLWIVGPHERRHGGRPVALAAVHENGEILYAAEHAPTAADAEEIRVVDCDAQQPEGSIDAAVCAAIKREHATEEVMEAIAEAIEEAPAAEAIASAAPRDLAYQEWADFIAILDAAIKAKRLTRAQAAEHSASEIGEVKRELEEIIRAIEDDPNPSDVERELLAAAVELQRGLTS